MLRVWMFIWLLSCNKKNSKNKKPFRSIFLFGLFTLLKLVIVAGNSWTDVFLARTTILACTNIENGNVFNLFVILIRTFVCLAWRFKLCWFTINENKGLDRIRTITIDTNVTTIREYQFNEPIPKQVHQTPSYPISKQKSYYSLPLYHSVRQTV